MIKLKLYSFICCLMFSSFFVQASQQLQTAGSEPIKVGNEHQADSVEQQTQISSNSTKPAKRKKRNSNNSLLLTLVAASIGIPLTCLALSKKSSQPAVPVPVPTLVPTPAAPVPATPVKPSVVLQPVVASASTAPTVPAQIQQPISVPTPAAQPQQKGIHYPIPFSEEYHPQPLNTCLKAAKHMINNALSTCVSENIGLWRWTLLPSTSTVDPNYIELMSEQFNLNHIDLSRPYVQITHIPDNSTIIFVGNIDGDLDALCKMFQDWRDKGLISANNEILQLDQTFFVFLGNYILSNPIYPHPRGGPYRQKVLLSSLFAFKLLNPQNVILMRGENDNVDAFFRHGYTDLDDRLAERVLNGFKVLMNDENRSKLMTAIKNPDYTQNDPQASPIIIDHLCKSLIPGVCLVFPDHSVLACWACWKNYDRMHWDNSDFVAFFENDLQTKFINVSFTADHFNTFEATSKSMFAERGFNYKGIFCYTSFGPTYDPTSATGLSYTSPSQSPTNAFRIALNSSKNYKINHFFRRDARLSDERGFSYAILKNGNSYSEWQITHVCQDGEHVLDLNS